jgi:hypothetical protein
MSINDTVDLIPMLKLIRDTTVQHCGFDRAADFLYDLPNHVVRVTWGTDRQGNAEFYEDIAFQLGTGPMEDCQDLDSTPGYVLTRNYGEQFIAAGNPRMIGVMNHGVVSLLQMMRRSGSSPSISFLPRDR